jgi:Arm DNA-binding domain
MGHRSEGLRGASPQGCRQDLILHYRAGSGRKALLRKFTIGKHGSPWTPYAAQKEAQRLLGLVAGGEDPAASKATERNVMTVAELCDFYLAEGVAHKKKSTLTADRAGIAHHIRPLLGKYLVVKLGRAE